jgi:hypothetical protein
VLRRAIAFVAGEAVAGIDGIQLDQQAVAIDLGKHAGGGDGEAFGVAFDDGLLRAGPVDAVEAVNQ